MKSEFPSAQSPRATPCRPGRSSLPHQPARRGVTATELLVVMMLLGILGVLSISLFTPSRKHTNIHGEALKINKIFSLARSYAVSSDEKYYQATFWLDNPSYWVDEIEASDPTDFKTVPKVLKRQITTPEKVFEQVRIAQFAGGVHDPELNTMSYRFFPDGTSDEGSVFLLRVEADPSGSSYHKVKLYGPTSRSEVFEDVTFP